MIQFNLLPDVKIQHVKSQRTKRLVILASIAVAGVSVGVLVLLFSYTLTQKRHLGNLNKDIDSLSSELQSNSELSRILTVQNQLKTLPGLYNGRPAVGRLPGYIDQTTPAGVGINSMSLDFSTSAMNVTGNAASLELVNNYVDTLKFTTFKTEDSSEATSAFKGVVLSSFGKTEKGASFTIDFTFDPAIFDETKNIQLVVPNIVTTRAQVPTQDLFNGSAQGEAQNAE